MIVLVPEIALTPQIVARFVARFGDTVAVLHSKLCAGRAPRRVGAAARAARRACASGRARRSSRRLRDARAVVVDEEHDASYKHEGDPRYDARRVAERRAAQAGAVLVAGSATPRPESVHALARLRLPAARRRRAAAAGRDRRHARGARARCTRARHEALADARKAIVLLNRRGWSNFLTCRSCGRAWGCPSCDVTLVMHRADGLLACHHCGHREPVPARCDACGSVSIARHGTGTERLESELDGARRLPPRRRGRRDSGARAGAPSSAAPRGVLVGTQMVAKGHDFPDVDLGVVLDADATLRFPDFRAEERTFALVTQLAGPRRARARAAGRVLVQTLAPEAPSIRFAAAPRRRRLPRRRARAPARAALSAVLDADPRRLLVAERRARRWPPRRRCASASRDALGPAPLFRLRGRERAPDRGQGAGPRAPPSRRSAPRSQAAAGDRAHRAAAFSVDVDPQ